MPTFKEENVSIFNTNAVDPAEPQTIPVQPIHGGEPLMCRSNVEKRIKAMGGSAVFGWKVIKDIYTESHVSHCVWQDDEGQLWDVTPVIDPDSVDPENGLCILDWTIESTLFIRDDAATFTDDSLPTRYVPTHRSPHVQEACGYMTLADKYLRKGDLWTCEKYTKKANRCMRKAGLRVCWDVPIGLTMTDLLSAGGRN